MLSLLFFLLPIAAVCGWLSGYYYRKNQQEPKTQLVAVGDYFTGLNYLINEQPDKAVDVFIKILEVDTETIEVHLTLGTLFRKRGEVDRATRIHQNLIARPQLSSKQRLQALLELGRDYLSAGVLDRAERLFLELLAAGDNVVDSLTSLIKIYQRQKDWQQAIVMGKKLAKLGDQEIKIAIAHYYCELAEKHYLEGRKQQAHNFLSEALRYDHKCARANIVLGRIFFADHNYQAAIEVWQKIQDQDADFLREIINDLVSCYQYINQEAQFITYLQDYVQSNPRTYLVMVITNYINQHQGNVVAVEYMMTQVQKVFSIRGLHYLLGLYLDKANAGNRHKILILREYIEKLLENKPVYRCMRCGFASKKLYWQCPGCNSWSMVKPIHGPEGD